jgi:potassium channel subfamily K, other eukaryote
MSSRYKSALHSKTFDSAVKKFRQKENEETEKISKMARPPAPRQHSSSSLAAATEAAQTEAEAELEQLPTQIIKQVRSFHDQMQFFVNSSQAGEEIVNEGQQGKAGIPRQLKKLLDEVAQFENIGGRAKREILEDDDTRNVSGSRTGYNPTDR